MLGWFVETTLVASGLAVVAALAGRLRSIGPTVRHLLWLVVLVRLMTPPMVSWPWAVQWGDLNWPLISASVAAVTPEFCADNSVSQPTAPFAETARLADLDRSQTTFRTAPAAAERVVDESGAADPDAPVLDGRTVESAATPDRAARLTVMLVIGWLIVTVLLGAGQSWRIIRFRGRLRTAVPAPEDLVEEAVRIGRYLGARAPELLVVPDLGTPLLWCLGRPRLLLPATLVKELDLDRWRGILTHELAHIRRGDHWVSRLELAGSLIWWWNPVYWLARTRLDAEAELACDAWVVSTLPKDRLAYAEALFSICSSLSMAKAPAPALGAAGSGRFFERRLTMILHDHVPCRLSPRALLAACLLALFALPSWSTAKPIAISNGETGVAARVLNINPVSTDAIADDANDDDDDSSIAKARADIKRAEAKLKKLEADAKKVKADAKKAKADAKKVKADAKKAESDGEEHKGDFQFDFSKLGETIEQSIEGKFGPDFEKKMEELGETIEKTIESNFGPDFEKRMEEFGEKLEKEIGDKFGPDFEKRMEEFGEKLGKDLEAKLGPGSEFEKKMKELGKEMEGKFGPGSDFEKKIKEQAEMLSSELQKKTAGMDSARDGGPKTGPDKDTAKVPIAKGRQRERRIAVLEDQIRKLADELKALKADDDRE
jgi:beta-lactamase regulating signal transducer with metallopeptidase domain